MTAVATAPLARLSAVAPHSNAGTRSALICSTAAALSEALTAELAAMRWSVRTALTAAAMFDLLEEAPASVCLVDSWLPDLDVHECVAELHALYPRMAMIALDGGALTAPSSPHPLRIEALHALRRAQAGLDGTVCAVSNHAAEAETPKAPAAQEGKLVVFAAPVLPLSEAAVPAQNTREDLTAAPLPEFLGSDPRLLEVSRRIRLVAARATAVLVHGETGTGKELVARAVHRLGGRAGKLVSVNCAAIPETLIESELFGHARGAFTGAQNRRTGRIEAADGGTLFLDEVGELSLAAQAKLLRFLESGTIQRVGENEEIAVNVRVVAATHRPLARMAREGQFRLDLLHRLSVFLIQTPALAGRTEDIDALIEQALREFAQPGEAVKRLDVDARAALHAHAWPGNVRELRHAVERACILAGTQPAVGRGCIDFGDALE